MGAIAGLNRWDRRPDAAASCAAMLAAQRIYGPDSTSQWSEDSVSLGRCLARFLPEDSHDGQPWISPDGRYILAADVRLDNREELCRTLNISGGAISDSEVLFRAWLAWGEDCCAHLYGDFAFAVWDSGQRRFVLARDPLGMRPLFFHAGQRFFAFASMPKGLHALGEIPRAPDTKYMAQCMMLAENHGAGTFYREIFRVEPGHVVSVSTAGITTRSWWQPPRQTLRLKNADEYGEALREKLDTAVRVRLRGMQHTGSQLSAGYDSSAVTATAARVMAPAGGRVTAFTAVPRDGYAGPVPAGRLADEGPLAARTAAMYPNIEHVLVQTPARSPLDQLDRFFYLFDQPAINLCNMVWIGAINDAAKARGLRVLLTGQTGNLTLSYDGSHLLSELLSSGRVFHLLRNIYAMRRRGTLGWRAIASAMFGPVLPEPLWQRVRRFAGGASGDLRDYTAIHPERFSEGLPAKQVLRPKPLHRLVDSVAARVQVLRRVDQGTFLKGMLGGWGLDWRDPTADRSLIEFCLSVPTGEFLRDGVPRALARRALADRLPPEVLEERKKGLQGADWHENLSTARAQAASEIERLADCMPAAETLDIARLRHLAANWPSGGWERGEAVQSYRLALLRGISIGHFLRRASGSNA